MSAIYFRLFLLAAYLLLVANIWIVVLSGFARAEEPIRVAIIDTGVDRSQVTHLCPSGHFNFVNNDKDITDRIGHGTMVASLIQKYAKDANYCLLIYKFFNSALSGEAVIRNSILAIKKAMDEGASIVNMSYGGNQYIEAEYLAISYSAATVFIAAAGNENEPLEKYFPAAYPLPNIISVGALARTGGRLAGSNYGKKVKAWELGEAMGESGTSVAAAIYTGKFVKTWRSPR